MKQLQTQEERWDTLLQHGVEEIFCQAFTETFAQLEGPAFLQGLLDSGLGVRVIVVGYDFRYGVRMEWGIEDLRDWCAKRDIRLIVVEPVRLGEEIVHSKGIRNALERGDCVTVTKLLGRPFTLRGTVESGQALGRTLGFPTANLTLGTDRLLPPPGVYRSWTQVGSRGYWSLSSLGYRPTVETGNSVQRLETYLYDFEGTLYGQEISVSLVDWVRGEQTFASIAALQEQVQKDLEVGRLCTVSRERLWLWDQVGETPIYLVPTDRFRRGVARIQVRAPLDAQAADRALAWSYVCEATQEYPSRDRLGKALNWLYGGGLDSQVFKSGTEQILELVVTGLIEAPEGSQRPFDSLLSLGLQLLREPVLVQGEKQGRGPEESGEAIWDSKRMELLRNFALDDLDSEQNDRALQAWNFALRQVFAGQPYGRLAAGERDEVAAVTARSAQHAYEKLLQEGQWAIYLAAPPEPRYLERIREGLQALRPKREKQGEELAECSPSAPVKPVGITQSNPPPKFLCTGERICREIPDLEQSRWVSLWQLPIPEGSLQTYAALLLNEVLGGEAHSLLFEEIREQRGLAYSIDSLCLLDRMLWSIQAGIHPGQEEEAQKACRHILEQVQKQGIEPLLIERARALIRMQLRIVRDDVRRMLRFFMQQQQRGDSFTPESLLELYEGMEPDTLRELARTLRPSLDCWFLGMSDSVGKQGQDSESHPHTSLAEAHHWTESCGLNTEEVSIAASQGEPNGNPEAEEGEART